MKYYLVTIETSVSIEPFDSMMQACRWLKENIDNLL